MALALYMDHHVPRAITIGLRLRQVEVLTAYEDGRSEADDSVLLDRAGKLGRVLFTHDDDLLMEASGRQKTGSYFSGVIFAHQLHISIGTCISNLELIAKVGIPEDLIGRVLFLPL